MNRKTVLRHWPRAFIALSLFANACFVVRVFFPQAVENLLLSMQAPPMLEISDHVRGDAKARATVVVYTDYQCPYCSRLHAMMQTLAKDTDFRLVYRHFPLAMHQGAQRAAEAAECASEQGRFWEFSDALFKPAKPIGGDADLQAIAADLQLEIRAFAVCLSSGRYTRRIDDQRAEGVRRGLVALPTFFINDRAISGLMPMAELKALLKEAADERS